MRNGQPLMLIEDNETDALNIERALKKSNINKNIIRFNTGVKAWDYLKDLEKDISSNLNLFPNLIILDLNMPLMNGFEFLTLLNRSINFSKIPVVVFTGSDQEKDLDQSFMNKAAGYFVKPSEPAEYPAIADAINSYWSLSCMPRIG